MAEPLPESRPAAATSSRERPHRRRRRALLTLAVTIAAVTASAAQDEAARGNAGSEPAVATVAAAPLPAALTTTDPRIPLDHLALLLEPLARDELAAQAEAWRDRLKAKATAIARVQIGADDAGGGATEKDRRDDVNALRAERDALLARLDAVLDAWEAKGGDTEEMRQYARAVSGIRVEVTDTGATLSALRGWLASEEGGIEWGLRLLRFLGILAVFFALSRVLGALVRKTIARSEHMSGLLKDFFDRFVRRTVFFAGLLLALSALGVEVGALLALIGGGAFILGFALQDSLGSAAAGMMLLLYRPFDVGDVVEVAGVSGKVDHVSLVNTTVRTFDNKVVLVPNKQVWGQVITNATASERRRVDMVFGIGYDDDIDEAKEILERVVTEHELVLEDPEPVVELNTLGESSVDFICRPWTRTADYWRVYWDVTRRVKQELTAAGISIPYPQRDLHIHRAASENEGGVGEERRQRDGGRA